MPFKWKNNGGSPTSALSASLIAAGSIAQGDFLLAMVDQGGGIVTPPDNTWHLIGSPNNGTNAVVFWKIAGASEPSSYTFSWASAGGYDWAIASWSGIAAAPIDKSTQSAGSGGGPYVAGSVTPLGSTDLLLCLCIVQHGGTYTPPAGMTSRLSVVSSTGDYLGIYELALASNAATPAETTTVAGGGNAKFWTTTIALTTTSAQVASPFVPTKRQYLRAAVVPANAPPAVSAASFSLPMPAVSGQVVGQMTATGSPTSWAITGGNASGNFAIDSTGKITVV